LRRLFPEEVIDPVRLIFRKRIVHHRIQLARGREVGPERFLDDDARPASLARFVQAGFLQVFQDRLELVGRDREIEKPVAAGTAFAIDLIEAFRQTFVAGGIVKFARVIEKRLAESIPHLIAHRLAGKLAGRFLLFLAEFFVGFFPTREADHRDGRRQFGSDVVERGN